MTMRTVDAAATLDLARPLPNPDLLIHFDRVLAAGGDRESIRRAERARRLTRIRRGTYVVTETWHALDSRQQHVLRAHAAQYYSAKPLLFSGVTAAAFWGIPFDGDYPDVVTVLQRYDGGGRSSPGVRRETWGHDSAQRMRIGAITLVTPARAALELARLQDTPAALATLDAVQSIRVPLRARLLRSDLDGELHRLGSRQRGRLAAIVEASSGLSGSFGESMARGVILLLGFTAPLLQHRVVDSQGDMFPDFTWPDGGPSGQGLFGEFDGKAKYTREEFTHGDPGEVVFREKRREDRLRATGAGVVRILWSHVMNHAEMERLLVFAGVPRQSSVSLAWTSWMNGRPAS